MSVFVFIIASLACYRLTVMVSRDAGPFDIFHNARKRFPKWLGCPFCFSVTAAAIIQTGIYLIDGTSDPIFLSACIGLAMSAISIILDRIFTSDYKG